MRSRVRTVFIVCLCITGINSSASAQTDFAAAAQEPTRLCSQAQKTDEFERAYWENSKSIRVRISLLSEWGMWRMLEAPSTPYLDRLAIAYQGSNLVSTANLPTLWHAVAESATLPDGVDPSPCEFVCCGGLGVANWPNRKKIGTSNLKSDTSTLLGRKIELQQQRVEYPLTIESS